MSPSTYVSGNQSIGAHMSLSPIRRIAYSLIMAISFGILGSQGASAVFGLPVHDGPGISQPSGGLNDFLSQPKMEKVVDSVVDAFTLVNNARQGASMISFYTGGGFLSFRNK